MLISRQGSHVDKISSVTVCLAVFSFFSVLIGGVELLAWYSNIFVIAYVLMKPATAISLVFLGLALYGMPRNTKCFVVSSMALLGVNAQQLWHYSTLGSFTFFSSPLCFVLLSIAVLLGYRSQNRKKNGAALGLILIVVIISLSTVFCHMLDRVLFVDKMTVLIAILLLIPSVLLAFYYLKKCQLKKFYLQSSYPIAIFCVEFSLSVFFSYLFLVNQEIFYENEIKVRSNYIVEKVSDDFKNSKESLNQLIQKYTVQYFDEDSHFFVNESEDKVPASSRWAHSSGLTLNGKSIEISFFPSERFIFEKVYLSSGIFFFLGFFSSFLSSVAIFFWQRTKSYNKKLMKAIRKNEESERTFWQVIESSTECILIAKKSGDIFFANQSCLLLLGYTLEEIVQLKVEHLIPKRFRKHHSEYRAAYSKEPSVRRMGETADIYALTKMGSEIPVYISLMPIARDGQVHTLCTIVDLSEQKAYADKIQKMALEDALTGIPNRFAFEKSALQALTLAKKSHRKFAFLLIDLDRFKNVNDSFGHESGDLLIQAVSERFSHCLKVEDLLFRLGGDEFVIIVHSFETIEQLYPICQNLLSSLESPFLVHSHTLNISCSIGVAYYAGGGETISDLLKHADTALYAAKNSGRGIFKFFSEEMNQQAESQLKIENALKEAYHKNEFYIVYQPIFDLKEQKIFGMEGLLRWHRLLEFGGSTEKMIDVLSELGVMQDLELSSIKKAFLEFFSMTPKEETMCLSLNLSPKELNSDFLEKLKSLIVELGIPAHRVIFELTETGIISDLESAKKLLVRLTDLGCRIFMDDFGTGYSSLNLIKHLPISGLKIDKSFIAAALSEERENQKIIESILILAENMGLEVIFEGVETQQQLAFVRQYQSHHQKVQGHYFSQPMPLSELLKYLPETVSKLPGMAYLK